MKIFTAAAIAASLFVPVMAHAEMREPVTITVRHADLDLRRADHRAQLDARIRRAAAIACGPVTTDLRRNSDISRCRWRRSRSPARTEIMNGARPGGPEHRPVAFHRGTDARSPS